MAYKKHVIGLAVMSALAASAQAADYGPFNGVDVNISGEDIVNIKNTGTGAAINQTDAGNSVSITGFAELLISAQNGSAYSDKTNVSGAAADVIQTNVGGSRVSFENYGSFFTNCESESREHRQQDWVNR